MDITEPKIMRDQVLILDEPNFNSSNVCIVTGAATGIGRATALAAAVNGLVVAGLDINEDEAVKTEKMALNFCYAVFKPISRPILHRMMISKML